MAEAEEGRVVVVGADALGRPGPVGDGARAGGGRFLLELAGPEKVKNLWGYDVDRYEVRAYGERSMKKGGEGAGQVSLRKNAAPVFLGYECTKAEARKAYQRVRRYLERGEFSVLKKTQWATVTVR